MSKIETIIVSYMSESADAKANIPLNVASLYYCTIIC